MIDWRSNQITQRHTNTKCAISFSPHSSPSFTLLSSHPFLLCPCVPLSCEKTLQSSSSPKVCLCVSRVLCCQNARRQSFLLFHTYLSVCFACFRYLVSQRNEARLLVCRSLSLTYYPAQKLTQHAGFKERRETKERFVFTANHWFKN